MVRPRRSSTHRLPDGIVAAPKGHSSSTATMSETMFSLLCLAVSKSDHVQSLTVHLCSPSWEQVSSLRALFAKNTSVSCVILESHDGSPEYAMDAVMGLRGSECVTELKIGAPKWTRSQASNSLKCLREMNP